MWDGTVFIGVRYEPEAPSVRAGRGSPVHKGAGADDLIYVSAEDGYLWVFDMNQVNGEGFFTFDENLREVTSPPLRVILAYEQDKKPLVYENGGPLRLVVITESPDVITEGSPWGKWVDRVEVKRG